MTDVLRVADQRYQLDLPAETLTVQTLNVLTGTTTTGAATFTASAPGVVPLTITGASGQTADLLDVTASGGAAGGTFAVATVASPVNGIRITNAATGTAPIIAATGTDAAVGLTIQTRNASAPVNAITISAGGTVNVGSIQLDPTGVISVTGSNLVRLSRIQDNTGANTTALTVGNATLSFYGVAAVARAGAIAAPATQTGAYVQADVQSIVTAVNAIRVALTNIGITS